MSLSDSTVLFRALPPTLKLTGNGRRILKDFANALSVEVAGGQTFECLVTNDRELRRLNSAFRQLDYATDVLSFPALPGQNTLGEVAISIQRAEAQAEEFGHTRLDEVRILMLHGVLHLIGLDHEADRGRMAQAERKWRLRFGLPPTLIARVRQRAAAEIHTVHVANKSRPRVAR